MTHRNIVFWSTPYTFSGKEKDAETGYGYFGARYYDSGLSIWLSVDPMSDKYPSMSPYNYCANNPVKLVDPSALSDINYLDCDNNVAGTVSFTQFRKLGAK
jgi:RHS repeat-associated protein